jgi:2-desacetyl-2-hydroxyethyl bacteriochlorophyllide A dehydrogenase
MKAAILRGPREIRTETVPDPVLDPDGIIIKVKVCGICGSDLHVYKREGRVGTIFGHEFSGDVVEVGSRVTGIAVGERVTAVGFRACGKCLWCRKGKPYRCSDMALLGYELPGAMAEYVFIPEAKPGFNVFKLPDELSYEDGASVEPLSISFFSVKRAQVIEKDTVAVIGMGVIGLNVVQILKSAGVAKILASGRRPSRLEAAKACGADLVVDSTKTDTLKAVMEATSGLGANIIIECAGTQETFDQAVGMAVGGGKVMLVGVYEQPLSWNPMPVISKNLSLVGCLGGNFPGAIELLKGGRVNTRRFITHTFPLDRADEAFRAQLKDPNAIKVMLRPQA